VKLLVDKSNGENIRCLVCTFLVPAFLVFVVYVCTSKVVRESKLPRAFKSSIKSGMNSPFLCPSASAGPKGQFDALCPAELQVCG